MKTPNRPRKNEIKAINAIQLNEEQKKAKQLIIDNQIVIVTGRAGSGKSLVCAQTALDFLKKKQVDCIWNTRAAIEVGKSLGFLPGELNEKFDPYMEAFLDNLNKCCTNKEEIDTLLKSEKIKASPIQFIRGKTIDDILIVEEAQNTTKAEMLAAKGAPSAVTSSSNESSTDAAPKKRGRKPGFKPSTITKAGRPAKKRGRKPKNA
jgi:phosphate starvation-inducible PhoH-like protein